MNKEENHRVNCRKNVDGIVASGASMPSRMLGAGASTCK